MLKTQFIDAKYYDGTFTDSNQLAQAQLVNPEYSDVLITALNRNGKQEMEGYGLIQALTQGSGAIADPSKFKVIGNKEYQWFLDPVNHIRAIPIADTTPTPHNGINFQEFIVPLQERYFSVGDVCIFADQTQARVTQEPYYQGSSWCYTMQIMGNNPQARVADWAMAVGQEVGFYFTAFEEGSEGGGIKAASYMAFRNQMNIQRMEFAMTGSAKTDKLIFAIQTKKNKSKVWLYKAQYDLMKQWMCAQENAIWGSKYNKFPDGQGVHHGASGRPLSMGSGIEEQISGINDIVASELTAEMLQYMLLDIQQKAGQADNKKLMVFGGHGFIKSFDTAMRRSIGADLGSYVLQGDYFIHKKTGNTLAYGSQFTTYKGLLGTEFTVVHHPYFDNKEIFTAIDPETGFTQKSFEGYFLDFSDYDATPNIQMFCKGVDGEDRRMRQWFTAGSTEYKFGNSSEAVLRSNGFDGFKYHVLSERMIVIMNPLGCGTIKIRKPGWLNPDGSRNGR